MKNLLVIASVLAASISLAKETKDVEPGVQTCEVNKLTHNKEIVTVAGTCKVVPNKAEKVDKSR